VGNIYRKAIESEKKNKLTFKPVVFNEDPLNHETGAISIADNAITINDDKKVYAYSQTQRYYVKYKD
jgi:hypothetical protein